MKMFPVYVTVVQIVVQIMQFIRNLAYVMTREKREKNYALQS